MIHLKMRILCILLCVVPIFGTPLPKAGCGYEACPALNESELNVHLIAHSHDDVGWLKTIDEYYYGSKSGIQLAGVQYILDSVIRALLDNPKRKYIQVESAYFYKWWQKQTDDKRKQVHMLVESGQLEIAGGGWSQNDEAAAHYQSIIDQFTFGLKYMSDTLGQCARPKIGWQIDPFGHTREMASIFAQMGYDAMFFARLDWRDKGERLSTKTAEMLWRGSANLGDDSLLFTHALYNHYSPPPGFYYDVLSQDDPLIDDARSTEYNLKAKVGDFTSYVRKQSSNYTSNNIIITMGNDFTYQDAHYNFKNLDILIKAYEDIAQYDSQNRRIRLLYSTPACYINAVNDYATKNETTYKIKTDDFIPYATDHHSYWSGYYTSRPTQKRFERQGNNLLQITKQLAVHSGDMAVEKRVNELRTAMGVMQHHDAITGTEKQPVANDYARIVMDAFNVGTSVIDEVMKRLLLKPDQTTDLTFKSCLLANVSHCDESQKSQFVVSVYNPLSRKVSHHVRLPVDSDDFEIKDFQGNIIEYQVTPRIDDFANIVPNITISKFDLVFFAKDLPPLGAKLFYIIRKNEGGEEIQPDVDVYDLGDGKNHAKISVTTGRLMETVINGLTINVKQDLMYYVAALGNNEISANRSSGAYIFRPDPITPEAKVFNEIIDDVKVYKGPLVDEVHQTFNATAKQIIRVYHKNPVGYIELDWLVGPINIEDNNGKEFISRFYLESMVPTDNFFTDSNGREIMKRTNNHRATYNYSNEEKVAGNYYPITSSISVVDENKQVQVSVLTDRAQGGACLKPGEMELMLHRRLLRDDAFGVGEALNEEEFGKGLRVRGQHFLTFGSTRPEDQPTAAKIRRDIAQKKILAPWVFIADASAPENTLQNLEIKFNSEFSLLQRDLSEQVQILTLERWTDTEVLIRFEHIMEISEGGTAETIDINGLFKLFTITSLYETTLAANVKLEESHRLQWASSGCLSTIDDCSTNEVPQGNKDVADGNIELKPMQIRTFIATIQMV